MGEKGKLIHAPMSDVGGVMFDKVSFFLDHVAKREDGRGEQKKGGSPS